jgi:NAD(P)-dependent dehydrogenase (short-subunit alcohol dehydrogenase family)
MSSMFDLSNRVAVVTGGNGGIGLAIAGALAQNGCAVSIWGRNAEKNGAAAASISKSGGRVRTQVCDVSIREHAAQATLEHFGRIDGCFANAGIGGGGRHAFIDRTDDD